MITAEKETDAHFLKEKLSSIVEIKSSIESRIVVLIEEECDGCVQKSECWSKHFVFMTLVGGHCHNRRER